MQQLVEGVKKLGLRGAAVGASVAGDEFSDPKFHPVWAKAEELGVLIFIHPQSTPALAGRFKGNGWLANTIGNPLDTTIALSHLIFEGTLDQVPRLKICAAHGGGFLPSYAPRSDNSLRVAPDMDTGVKLKKKPTEYLRQMYYDTLVFTSEALRHLAAEVGVNRLVIGTDHPIPWQDKSVDHVLKTPGFSNAERRAMLGETAAKLLGIKRAIATWRCPYSTSPSSLMSARSTRVPWAVSSNPCCPTSSFSMFSRLRWHRQRRQGRHFQSTTDLFFLFARSLRGNSPSVASLRLLEEKVSATMG